MAETVTPSLVQRFASFNPNQSGFTIKPERPDVILPEVSRQTSRAAGAIGR